MCDLHKTVVYKLIDTLSILNNNISKFLFRLVILLMPVFVSFTANARLKFFLRCYAAVERAGPTSIFFIHSTFGSHLGGVASGMVH